MRERHWYSDSVVDPKTIWSNKLAVEELIKSWPCNKECFIHIQSHLVTRQTRWRQFGRAQHVAWQGKGWLTPRWSEKANSWKQLQVYKHNWWGRRVERRKQQKRKLSSKDGQEPGEKKQYQNSHLRRRAGPSVIYFVHMAALVCEQLSLISDEICLMARDHLFSGTLSQQDGQRDEVKR